MFTPKAFASVPSSLELFRQQSSPLPSHVSWPSALSGLSLMKTHITLSVVLVVGVVAEKNESTWLYPPDPKEEGAAAFSGLNVNYGDSMLTEYTSNYPSSVNDPLTMALYCGTSNIQRSYRPQYQTELQAR